MTHTFVMGSASQTDRPPSRLARSWHVLRLYAHQCPPLLAWWLSPLLVVITTWIVYSIQEHLIAVGHLHQIRPFSIAFLVPVMILTAFGGRRIGLLTLALSALSCTLFLEPPPLDLAVHSARNGVEICCLLLVGVIVIAAADTRQQRTGFLEEETGTPMAASLALAVQEIACQVPGVRGLGACRLYKQGLDLSLGLDIVVEPDASLREALAIADEVKSVLMGELPLLFKVYIHPVLQEERAKLESVEGHRLSDGKTEAGLTPGTKASRAPTFLNRVASKGGPLRFARYLFFSTLLNLVFQVLLGIVAPTMTWWEARRAKRGSS